MKNTKLIKNLDITIGIPTYLGDEHLVAVLRSLNKQTCRYLVSEIIVVVDGKKLHPNIYKKIKHPKLKILYFNQRQGQSARINNLIDYSKGKILLLVNDDVILPDNVLEIIATNYLKTKADLIAGRVEPFLARNKMEKILKIGSNIKYHIISSTKHYDSYLACNGRVLALSKRLRRSLRVPNDLWNNDAYMYLYTKKHKMKFLYINKQFCFYRDPSNIREFLNQSLKFQDSLSENRNYFKNFKIDKYYDISQQKKLNALKNQIMINPINSFIYILFFILVRFISRVSFNNTTMRAKSYWRTDRSTKNVIS